MWCLKQSAKYSPVISAQQVKLQFAESLHARHWAEKTENQRGTVMCPRVIELWRCRTSPRTPALTFLMPFLTTSTLPFFFYFCLSFLSSSVSLLAPSFLPSILPIPPLFFYMSNVFWESTIMPVSCRCLEKKRWKNISRHRWLTNLENNFKTNLEVLMSAYLPDLRSWTIRWVSYQLTSIKVLLFCFSFETFPLYKGILIYSMGYIKERNKYKN